jgi:hypothetical protein
VNGAELKKGKKTRFIVSKSLLRFVSSKSWLEKWSIIFNDFSKEEKISQFNFISPLETYPCKRVETMMTVICE